MPTPGRRRGPGPRLVPARDRRRLGRGRAGGRRPRGRRTPGAAGRRPGAAGGARGRRLGRRPAADPPPAVPARRPRRRRDHAEGPHAGDPDPGRLRPADGPHQRRPRQPGRLRRAGPRARAARRPTGRARAARRSTSSWCSPRSATPRRSGRPWPRPAPARSATTTPSPTAWPARAASGRWPGANPTVGTRRRAGGHRRAPDRGGAARARRAEVVRAVLAAHSYEEVAYDVIELADPGTAPTGAGRVGDVDETTLGEYAGTVAGALPADRPRGARRRRPRPRRTPGGGDAGEPATSCSTEALSQRRRRLRHQRPAPPRGGASSSRRAGRRCSTCRHWAAEWTWLPGAGGAAG